MKLLSKSKINFQGEVIQTVTFETEEYDEEIKKQAWAWYKNNRPKIPANMAVNEFTNWFCKNYIKGSVLYAVWGRFNPKTAFFIPLQFRRIMESVNKAMPRKTSKGNYQTYFKTLGYDKVWTGQEIDVANRRKAFVIEVLKETIENTMEDSANREKILDEVDFLEQQPHIIGEPIKYY